jgi:ribonucleoside-diphosphate reductase alpha chain
MNYQELMAAGEVPEWMTEDSFQTVSRGYLLKGETPKGMYARVAKAAGSYYADSKHWEKVFFDAMWRNWLCAASPILSNMGTERGLPISCNGFEVGDSLDSIFKKNHELAMLSKNGAGVSGYLGNIRGRGTEIKGNGKSEGVIPWAKIYDTTTLSVNQGSTRRGATSLYLPVEHGDAEEWVNMRRPTGDANRRCLNIHHGLIVTDKWMEEMLAGDDKKRKQWEAILTARVETGEPYLFFSDNVNKHLPQCYIDRKMKVKFSNLCTEIALFSDLKHTFVCCLSSLNALKWDEWKDSDLPEIATRFLDAVIEEYIKKASKTEGLENSVRSAIKGRAIGIGILGWHSLLQSNMIPFDSFKAMMLNNQIFKKIRVGFEKETAILAKELGEPEWCKGSGRRNTHGLAQAPTKTNSLISSAGSEGTDPIAANIFVVKSAKGTWITKNKRLETLLEIKGKNNEATWKSINQHSGSVQQLSFLTDEEKAVFLTAREINQFAIIKQAAQRQKWIDQAASVNLFFANNSSVKYIHDVHVDAWKSGVKTLYYLRNEGVIKGDLASRSSTECAACEA